MLDVGRTVVGGLLAALMWFVVGGALYMNPITAKAYKDAEGHPSMKKWPHLGVYLGWMFAGGSLIPCLLWAFVFVFVSPVLPVPLFMRGLTFGLLLVVIKILPRGFDMWIQTTYPPVILLIELFNGTLGSLLIGLVFAYTMG